jgi:hypothetical protein
MYLEHYREVQTIKDLLIEIILVMRFFSDDLFRAAQYRMMLVFNKDALFHFWGPSTLLALFTNK